MQMNEQVDVADDTPVKCDGCGCTRPRCHMMILDRGILPGGGNIYGLVDGTYCVLCVGQRKQQLVKAGLFTGEILDSQISIS